MNKVAASIPTNSPIRGQCPGLCIPRGWEDVPPSPPARFALEEDLAQVHQALLLSLGQGVIYGVETLPWWVRGRAQGGDLAVSAALEGMRRAPGTPFCPVPSHPTAWDPKAPFPEAFPTPRAQVSVTPSATTKMPSCNTAMPLPGPALSKSCKKRRKSPREDTAGPALPS